MEVTFKEIHHQHSPQLTLVKGLFSEYIRCFGFNDSMARMKVSELLLS